MTGRIATHVLGPEFKGKGFEAAGGLAFDPYKTPNHSGSVAKAKAEMRKAGYANGMYNGPAVTMYTFNSTPSPQVAKVVAASLAKIGIKANIKLASIDAMFTKFCVVQRYLPEICTLGWLPDFKDPVTMLDPLFNGKAINPNYTNNTSLFDDPQVNAAMEKAKRIKNPTCPIRGVGQDRPHGHVEGAHGHDPVVEHPERRLGPNRPSQVALERGAARSVGDVDQVRRS